MKSRVVVVAALVLMPFLASGCACVQANTTLKPSRDRTFARAEGKFHVDSIDWAGSDVKTGPTVDRFNKIASHIYPELFSNNPDAWPVKLSVKNRSKLDYDYSYWTILTLFAIPFPAQKTANYDVDVTVHGEPAETISFNVEETSWVALPGTGILPLLWPNDAAGISLNFDNESVMRLIYASIVEAAAQTLRRQAEFAGSSYPLDQKLLAQARTKAQTLGYNPVPVYIDENGTMFVVEGTGFETKKGELFVREAKDMLVNVGDASCNVEDKVLKKGEYLFLRDGKIYKESMELAAASPTSAVPAVTSSSGK